MNQVLAKLNYNKDAQNNQRIWFGFKLIQLIIIQSEQMVENLQVGIGKNEQAAIYQWLEAK